MSKHELPCRGEYLRSASVEVVTAASIPQGEAIAEGGGQVWV